MNLVVQVSVLFNMFHECRYSWYTQKLSNKNHQHISLGPQRGVISTCIHYIQVFNYCSTYYNFAKQLYRRKYGKILPVFNSGVSKFSCAAGEVDARSEYSSSSTMQITNFKLFKTVQTALPKYYGELRVK